MAYLVTSAAFFLAFAISFMIERRRLVNGVLLMIALFCLFIGLLFELMKIPAIDDAITSYLVTILIAFAILVLLPGFLVVNGLLMLRREGLRFGNLLSLLAGLGIFAFVPLMILIGKLRNEALEVAFVSVSIVLVYLSLAFVCFLLSSIAYASAPRRVRADFIVVLGSRLIRSAVPPLLASRLNRARKIFDAETAKGGEPMIITSGGQGGDEEMPEARAMADYLIEAGAPADRILIEDRSTTTEENLRYSKEIMADRQPSHRCLVVTNNFHAFRTALLTRRLRVDGQVIGSRTALYYVPSATIREFVGVLRDHWKLNATVCVLLAAISPVLLLID